MKVEVKPLSPSLLVQSRGGAVTELRGALNDIEADEDLHNKLLTLAVYSLPDEKDQAHAHKQSLQNTYGRGPDVLGYQFSVARATDNSEEYLAVKYMPQEVVDGAWEEFQAEKKEAARLARERKQEREIEAQLKEAE